MATKRATSPMNTKKTKSPMSKTKQPKPSVWIEELPMDELKLEYNHFRNAYKEFRVLSELTITVLQDMGIFLKPLLRNTTGQMMNEFNEFDDSDDSGMEQAMSDGIFQDGTEEYAKMVDNSGMVMDDFSPTSKRKSSKKLGEDPAPYESIQVTKERL